METENIDCMGVAVKPCPVCGASADVYGNRTCKCNIKNVTKATSPPPAPKPSTRNRLHNYRTNGTPPQGTDKHVDELK